MYFDWNYRINDFMFDNLNIDSIEKCLLIVFIVFCLAYLTEVIKTFQKILNKKLQAKWFIATPDQNNETTPLVNSLRIPIDHSIVKKRRIQNHLVQSLMYMLNLTIGYFLMLVAMAMYAGHFLAIIIGMGFGYYFLNVISPDFYESISDKSININQSENMPRSSNYDQI
ncbi:unnamed protein product [Brachionus calyciflorus]|uniref:Copper transport protein n=1 Tax=Brachionus calyciflorus TaxID=104777 RepID=A0A813SQ82_9BILA|nr:unnamed protein product [Brachionus calyciflorus]